MIYDYSVTGKNWDRKGNGDNVVFLKQLNCPL